MNKKIVKFFLKGLAVSLGLISFSTLLAKLVEPLIGGNTIFFLFAAVILCSFYSGMAIATIAATLAGISYNYFFQYPLHTLSADFQDVLELAMFWITAVFVSFFGDRFRKARELAEKESLAKERVLAIVSHELKNPLSAIITSAQAISKSPDERARKYGEVIRRASERMETMVEDLLEFARLSEGAIDLRIQSVDAGSLLQSLHQEMNPLAESKDISLQCKLVGPDFTIQGDPGRLQEIFSNLVGNALKFSRRHSTVKVTARIEHLKAIFTVEDEGPGIPPHQLPRLFERFWQAPETAHLGSGLGLAIAKAFIDAHYGKITVSSQVGKGTKFQVVFPAPGLSKVAA